MNVLTDESARFHTEISAVNTPPVGVARKRKLITQREAAQELGVSVRQVKRLLFALKKRGDKAVIHGLRGKPSNRKIEEKIEQEAVKILSAPVYQGFGPTLASEYLSKEHGIASKATVRQWMKRGRRAVEFKANVTHRRHAPRPL